MTYESHKPEPNDNFPETVEQLASASSSSEGLWEEFLWYLWVTFRITFLIFCVLAPIPLILVWLQGEAVFDWVSNYALRFGVAWIALLVAIPLGLLVAHMTSSGGKS